MIKETFGVHIRSLRKKKGYTLTKLAAALDIDQSTLSKIENCKKKVPLNALPKLAHIFDLDLAQLESEFYSEQIAKMLYTIKNPKAILNLAEEKIEYVKVRQTKQSKLAI